MFPIHPRTKKKMQLYKLFNELRNNKLIKIIDPIGYIDFMCLQKNARIAITDSVGIQEETTFWCSFYYSSRKHRKTNYDI